jgi:AmmeMemoRadiSam system protein A
MSPRFEALANSSDPFPAGPGEFSVPERQLLLKLAHESIMAAVENRPFAGEAPSPHLAEPRGVFTTIYHRGHLRGCVGYALAVASLYQTVIETARAAALADSRFPPVSPQEAPDLQISLSVLSPLQPIRPEQVEVGRHGLIVSLGRRRGLLLPQVAAEHGWDRQTLLEQTCRKAGLPLDAWRSGAELQAFTAEGFGDDEVPTPAWK